MDFSDYYPAGVTEKMIQKLYRVELCRLCGHDKDEEGFCQFCYDMESKWEVEDER